TGKAHSLHPVHQGPVQAVALGDKRVLTGSGDTTARLWDITTGKHLTLPHPGRVGAVALSPDGKTALTGSVDRTKIASTGRQDGIAQLWNAVTGERIGPPLRHEGNIYSVAFRSDGKTIVTASEDGTAQVWNATTGEAIGPRLRH